MPLPNPNITDLNQSPLPDAYSHAGMREYFGGGFFGGGDYQFAERIGNFILTGCHCQDPDASRRWGRPDIGAIYNSVTGERTRHTVAMAIHVNGPKKDQVADFMPDILGGLDGAWAATGDSRGCLWIGGDIYGAGVRTVGRRTFASGFARFCQPPGDGVTSLSVSSQSFSQITLQWGEPNNGATAGYTIERNGRFLGYVRAGEPLRYTDATVSPFQSYTYTVIPESAEGLKGDGTSINATSGEDLERPTIPTGLAVTENGADAVLTWNAASDDTAVTGYLVYRDGQYLAWTPSLTYTDAGNAAERGGYAIRSVDLAGKRSSATDLVYADGNDPNGDDQAPTVPGQPLITGAEGAAVLTWTASTDNIGVEGYAVNKNGAYLGYTTTNRFEDDEAEFGDVYSVRAQDAAGNRSERSDSQSFVDPAGPDQTPPSIPTGVTAELVAGGVQLDWNPSTDDRELGGYLIFRDGGYVTWTPTPGYLDPDGRNGSAYQLRAVDKAQNRSDKSVEIVAGGVDTEPPRRPDQRQRPAQRSGHRPHLGRSDRQRRGDGLPDLPQRRLRRVVADHQLHRRLRRRRTERVPGPCGRPGPEPIGQVACGRGRLVGVPHSRPRSSSSPGVRRRPAPPPDRRPPRRARPSSRP